MSAPEIAGRDAVLQRAESVGEHNPAREAGVSSVAAEAFRENVRNILRARGISARRASLECGLSAGWLKAFLSGRAKAVRSDNAQRLAWLLDMPLDRLIVPSVAGTAAPDASDRRNAIIANNGSDAEDAQTYQAYTHDLKSRIAYLEQGYAAVQSRLDRIEGRLDRIERRLRLADYEGR